MKFTEAELSEMVRMGTYQGRPVIRKKPFSANTAKEQIHFIDVCVDDKWYRIKQVFPYAENRKATKGLSPYTQNGKTVADIIVRYSYTTL